jgi:hypothetical protein
MIFGKTQTNEIHAGFMTGIPRIRVLAYKLSVMQRKVLFRILYSLLLAPTLSQINPIRTHIQFPQNLFRYSIPIY